MPKYSPVVITYISLNILSLLLLTFLIIRLLLAPNHFTKYTQLQLFIAAWGYTIGFLPSIIKYGDDLINDAFDTRISLCMIQQLVSLFFFYPLYILPVVLGLYIWHSVEKRNITIEKKFFWIFSCVIWCFTVCFSVFSFADGYPNDNFGIQVTPLLCKAPYSKLHRITYLIIIPVLFVITFVSMFFVSAMLWKRWQQFSTRKNRWTALRLGHGLRLFTCCFIYTIFLGTSIISRIIFQYLRDPKNQIEIEDFVQPLFGIFLFLIFAKNDSPTIFLPCLYYGGPENLTFKSESYYRGDSFLFLRPPSLTLTNETNPSPSPSPPNTPNNPINIMQTVTTTTTISTTNDDDVEYRVMEFV